MRRPSLRVVIISVAVALVLGFLPFAERYFAFPGDAQTLGGQLNDVQKQAITAATGVTTLLINWSFALIGFTAWMIRRHVEGTAAMTAGGKATAAVATVAAVASIFFGQLVLSSIAVLLSKDVFSLDNRAIRLPAGLQFLCLLIALGAVAVHLIGSVFWAAPPPVRLIGREE